MQLEEPVPLSESALWRWQRAYFAARGVNAWRHGEVPHYITSNPTIAAAYAEIVLAFWRDRNRLAAAGEGGDEPLTICELGAGSGRFAFHFLRRLAHLCMQAGVRPDAFRYVLTDAADENLKFWRGHPRFQPFFADGLLEVARLDVTQDDELVLQVSGDTITPGRLRRPLVVIANYVFDGVPQDLFHFTGGRRRRCLVSLSVDEDAATLDAAELLARVRVHYDDEGVTRRPYDEPWLESLLAGYRRDLHDTHLLFPAAGLRSLHRLAALSQQGILVLSADKGEHRLDAWEGRPVPGLVRHGSVSLPVNYHAFVRFCEQAGGLALVPARRHGSIDVVALLMLPDAARHAATRDAYQRHVQEFGPDGFFSITKHARRTIPQMSAEDILAYLRLSHHDSHLFARYLPRLLELAGELDAATREDVKAAVEKVWEAYFPLGEGHDLANRIAGLFYAMDDYPGALAYFACSIEIYGRDTGTLYNMAVCHHLLGRNAAAGAALRTVLQHDPANHPARMLLADCEGAAGLGRTAART